MKNYNFKFSNIIYLTILNNHENKNLAFKTLVIKTLSQKLRWNLDIMVQIETTYLLSLYSDEDIFSGFTM